MPSFHTSFLKLQIITILKRICFTILISILFISCERSEHDLVIMDCLIMKTICLWTRLHTFKLSVLWYVLRSVLRVVLQYILRYVRSIYTIWPAICPTICHTSCPMICPMIWRTMCPRILPIISSTICLRIFPTICPTIYPRICPTVHLYDMIYNLFYDMS